MSELVKSEEAIFRHFDDLRLVSAIRTARRKVIGSPAWKNAKFSDLRFLCF